MVYSPQWYDVLYPGIVGACFSVLTITEWLKRQQRSPINGNLMGTRLLPTAQVRNTIEHLVRSGAIDGDRAKAWQAKRTDPAWEYFRCRYDVQYKKQKQVYPNIKFAPERAWATLDEKQKQRWASRASEIALLG